MVPNRLTLSYAHECRLTLVGSRRVHYHQIKPLSLFRVLLSSFQLLTPLLLLPNLSSSPLLRYTIPLSSLNIIIICSQNSKNVCLFIDEFGLCSVSKFHSMASTQLTAIASSVPTTSFERLRPSTFQMGRVRIGNLPQRSFRGLVVKAATVVAPKVCLYLYILF